MGIRVRTLGRGRGRRAAGWPTRAAALAQQYNCPSGEAQSWRCCPAATTAAQAARAARRSKEASASTNARRARRRERAAKHRHLRSAGRRRPPRRASAGQPRSATGTRREARQLHWSRGPGPVAQQRISKPIVRLFAYVSGAESARAPRDAARAGLVAHNLKVVLGENRSRPAARIDPCAMSEKRKRMHRRTFTGDNPCTGQQRGQVVDRARGPHSFRATNEVRYFAVHRASEGRIAKHVSLRVIVNMCKNEQK